MKIATKTPRHKEKLATEFRRTQRISDTDLHCLFRQIIFKIILCSKQKALLEIAISVPAILLCPQAESRPLLKQNTVTTQFLTVDYTDSIDF